MTSVRRSGRALLALAAVIGLAGMAGCSSGGTDASVQVEVIDDASPADRLAHAAEATASVETGRMRMTADYEFEVDGEVAVASMEMEGVFADRGRRSEMTVDMGGYLESMMSQLSVIAGQDAPELPDSMVMRMVQDGARVYLKYDIVPAEPGMEHWYVVDYDEMGLDTSQMQSPAGMGGGPTSYLESIKGAGADVAEAGRTEVDGVEVTRYEGTIDPQAAIDRADPDKRAELRSMMRQSGMGDPMPFTAYVDDDGVLRRMEMTMSAEMGGAGGMAMTARLTMDYYDFGADITITTPPADLVRDASELTDLGA